MIKQNFNIFAHCLNLSNIFTFFCFLQCKKKISQKCSRNIVIGTGRYFNLKTFLYAKFLFFKEKFNQYLYFCLFPYYQEDNFLCLNPICLTRFFSLTQICYKKNSKILKLFTTKFLVFIFWSRNPYGILAHKSGTLNFLP